MSFTRVLQSAPISKMSPTGLVIFICTVVVLVVRDAHELQQGLGGPASPVEGTTRLLPGQSTVRNVREIRERPWRGVLNHSYLELGEQLPGLREIRRTGFKHTLKLLIE